MSREHLFLPEYKQSIRESVLQESTINTYNVQMQVAQAAQAMTIEDMNTVKMLERTKEIIVIKIKK